MIPILQCTRGLHGPALGAAAIAALLVAGAGTATPQAAPPNVGEEGMARVEVLVEGTSHSARGARSEAAFYLRTLRAALGQIGVPIEEVRVGEALVTPVHERVVVPRRRGEPLRPRILGYRAWIPVTILTAEHHRLGLLIDTAVGAGAALVEGIEEGDGNGVER